MQILIIDCIFQSGAYSKQRHDTDKEIMMDTTPVDLSHLFEQLGLDNSDEAMVQFITAHKLASHIHLSQASFWTSAQKSFIIEALEADAQWTELIEQLDTQLRKP